MERARVLHVAYHAVATGLEYELAGEGDIPPVHANSIAVIARIASNVAAKSTLIEARWNMACRETCPEDSSHTHIRITLG